jgi:hypothetical protein
MYVGMVLTYAMAQEKQVFEKIKSPTILVGLFFNTAASGIPFPKIHIVVRDRLLKLS